ncbi:hypothetical protein [Segetibacter aerophilus]|uniref:N-acetyltransferase domain-containing protein n=1 Tax=Segetibacter aerophilus TaxID=670293 RepID=A0A512BFB3_9BACT|nr:hypothetical protein [Segetibacter aerophilus]GEO10527.1 hypothetical protein SAE01_30230 [Segetibacter aerophilus]
MQITEVTDKRTEKEFLEINVLMNRHNPKYIQPLDNEVRDVFDPQKNKAFKNGTAKRWILKDNQGSLLGRIAAFVSSKYINKGDTYPVGSCGFFDCIDDQSAANLLFDTAKEWLRENDVEAMDGPVNFGERDKWWGLMVEGFDEEPLYGISFNPRYYEKLFEGYGFQNYYNQYYYTLAAYGTLSDKYRERHAKFASKPDYSARHVDKSNLPKFAKDFSTIYNLAWAQHNEGKEISTQAALKLFNKMKPIMDESLVWFAYYKEDPIGMWVNIPDLNQYFKYFKGKFGWWQKLRLLLLQKTKPSRKINGVAFGIVPKFQGLGIDAFMIYSGTLVIRKEGKYDLIEMGWAGDWNPRMIGIYKALGGTQSRRMITYRYIFDRSRPFERHPVVG